MVFWAAQARKRHLRREKSAKHVEFLGASRPNTGLPQSRKACFLPIVRRGASSVRDLTFLKFWPQGLCTYPSRSHHRGRALRSGCSVSQWKSSLGISAPCLDAARVVNLSKVVPHVLAAGEICCGNPERKQFETPSSENPEIKRALSVYRAVRSLEAL